MTNGWDGPENLPAVDALYAEAYLRESAALQEWETGGALWARTLQGAKKGESDALVQFIWAVRGRVRQKSGPYLEANAPLEEEDFTYWGCLFAARALEKPEREGIEDNLGQWVDRWAEEEMDAYLPF